MHNIEYYFEKGGILPEKRESGKGIYLEKAKRTERSTLGMGERRVSQERPMYIRVQKT